MKKISRITILIVIVWSLVLISLTVFGVSIFSSREKYLSSVTTFIQKNIPFLNKKYQGPNGLAKREVVQEESSIVSVVDTVSPSVVSIVVKTTGFSPLSGPAVSESGIGTGFIVSVNGLIVTNSHVVDDPTGEYSVVLKDGTTYEVSKVHLDEFSDLAILEISARNLPVVTFGDSEGLKVGQTAIAIGNALGKYQNTVTVGVISGIARELRASGGLGDSKVYEDAIQTDAALNPGNSGGPLLNSAGDVVGINVATTFGAENISFAIPVNNLKPILESFLKEGKIVKAYLGVSYTVISKELAAIRSLPEGAFVSSVLNNSPAKKAGIVRGDIIKKLDGKDVNSQVSLGKLVSQKKPGDKVDMVMDRDGKEVKLNVTLEQVPENLNNN